MKLITGDYEGASTFAQFDKPIAEMTEAEAKGLLECILHRAMPGEECHQIVFEELAIAEQLWKEQQP